MLVAALARVPGAWQRTAAQAWASTARTLWQDGDCVEVELVEGGLRVSASRQAVTLRPGLITEYTRHGDSLFLWTKALSFLPIDGAQLEEGDSDGFAAAVERAIADGADAAPVGVAIPEGAPRYRGAPLWEEWLRSLAATAVFQPRLVVFLALGGLAAALGAWLGLRVWVAAGLLVWVLYGAPLVTLSARILRRWRQPRAEWAELAVADGKLYLRSPVDGGVLPLTQVQRLYRWPGGAVWIRVQMTAYFVRRRVMEGDRAAFLAALEEGIRPAPAERG